ncbi:MAG TPA: adenine methyltransferase, partial [Clostridiales bacterium]|nr:adenine methyltransferase [Clostridiales bacterium]
MINRSLFTSDKKDWGTPQTLFDTLNNEFNFTLDVCANE